MMLINLVTFPIFSKNLSPLDFSIMGYYESISQIFLPIMNLSLYTYYMKDYFIRTAEENQRVLVSSMLFLSVSNLILIIIGLGVLYIYFELAQVSFPLFPYVLLALLPQYFSIYTAFLNIEYKMKKQGRKFFAISVVGGISAIVFSLFLVVPFGLGATGKMLGILISQLIIGVFAYKKLYKKASFDFSIIKKALVFGTPLIIMAFLDFPTNYIDRILLERQNDVANFALYSISIKIAGFIFILSSAIFQAFEPDFYKFTAQKRTKEFLQSVLLVFGFLFIINILFSVSSEPLVALLTSGRYTESYVYANIIIWGNYFLAFSYLLGIIMIVKNQTRLMLYIKIVMAIIGGTVFPIFISQWSFWGAAYARILINVVTCLLLLIVIIMSSEGLRTIIKNRIKAS